MKIFLWCLVAVIASVEFYWACKFTEYVYCAFIRRQPPNEPSVHIHHVAVVRALRAYYPGARRICEIGCGSGGMVRYIARRVPAQVTGIENMPLSILMARMRNLFCKNIIIKWMDAFEFLDAASQKFDVAVAYLGPCMTPMLARYKTVFPVLISLNFEIPGRRATHVIDLKGFVWFNGRKYTHRLYVYEF